MSLQTDTLPAKEVAGIKRKRRKHNMRPGEEGKDSLATGGH